MKLPEFSVKHPIAISMLFLAILVLGVICSLKLGIDLMPEIEPPAISVVTVYPGANAVDVETKVTRHVEDTLSIVPNLDKINSISKDNLSVVTCLFDWGSNLDTASNDIRDRLEFVKRLLPEDIEQPMLFKFNTSMMPILFIGVTADESFPKLYHITDKYIADALKTVPGVGAARIVGAEGLKRQINVIFDRERLQSFDLSVQQVISALADENITLPAGTFKMGKTEYVVRVPGEFATPDEIGETLIAVKDGASVYLKDIARVEDSYKEKRVFARMEKKEAVLLMIQKQSGANAVAVAQRAKEKLDHLMKSSLPSDIKITVSADTSEMIVWTIKTLWGTVVWGGVLVVLITLLLLRQLRGSFIICLAIPFSLIVAFIFLYLGGFTINVMSLTSLAMAIGMVVDNAVVVLENIIRHRESGEDIQPAAITGTSEVGLAVSASTLTTVVIFLPLIFLKGVVGVMFHQLAYIVSATLLASLFVSLTLTPMLTSKLLVVHKFEEMKFKTGIGRFLQGVYKISEGVFARVENGYASMIEWALEHRKKTMIYACALFGFSMLMIPIVGTDFIPKTDSGDLEFLIELPVGTRLEKSLEISKQLEDFMKKNIPELKAMFSWGGESELGFGVLMGSNEGTNVIELGGKLLHKEQRDRSIEQINEVIRQYLATIPEVVKVEMRSGSPMQRMLFAGAKPMSIEIIGHDLAKTDKLALEIKNLISSVNGVVDISISRDHGRPEVLVDVDRKKAGTMGLTMSMIVDTLRSHIYGKVATKYREEGEDYDIFVRMDDKEKQTAEQLEDIGIMSMGKKIVPLKSVARLSYVTGPIRIDRKDQERIVKVESGVYKRALGDVVDDVKKKIQSLDIASDVKIRFGGEVEEKGKAFADLKWLFLLGVLLVYMVMAAQFESLKDPFVIMFSVPFALTGVIFGFLLTGTSLSIISFIGLIMLIGIVVNNAIVLIDYTNQMRAQGMKLYEAVVVSCRRRLRPILMTTLTTVFGTLPMAAFSGEGAEIWRPLGITLIGGLSLSTFVTLILIPTMYFIFEKKGK